MATRDGYYGSDGDDNTFTITGSDKKYFTLVNEKTGEVQVWQDNDDKDNPFVSDKRIGNINPETGKINYNSNWFSNVSKKDRQLVNDNLSTIKDASRNTATNGLITKKGIKPGEAKNQANDLLNNNRAFVAQNALYNPSNKQLEKAIAGAADVGT